MANKKIELIKDTATDYRRGIYDNNNKEVLGMCTLELRELETMLVEAGLYNSSIEGQFESLYEELEEGLYAMASSTLIEIRSEIKDVFGVKV